METVFWLWEVGFFYLIIFYRVRNTQRTVGALSSDTVHRARTLSQGCRTPRALLCPAPCGGGSALASHTAIQAQFLNFSIFCFCKDKNQLLIATLTSDTQAILAKWSFPTILLPVRGDPERVDVSWVKKQNKTQTQETDILPEFWVFGHRCGFDPAHSFCQPSSLLLRGPL